MLNRNEVLLIMIVLPKILGEVFFHFLHILEEGETPRMSISVVGGIILYSFVLEMELLGHVDIILNLCVKY